MYIRKYNENDKTNILNIYNQSKLDELKFENIEHKLLSLKEDKVRFSKLNEKPGSDHNTF